MNLDPGLAAVICSLIAAGASLWGVRRTTRQDRKIDETHRTLTTNHHSSPEPTVLDRLDNLSTRMTRVEKELKISNE